MESRHTLTDLYQMQSLPLSAKVRMTQLRIKAWVEEFGEDNVYVSRSGGKDSDVLGHIVKEMYPDIKQVFVNTGLEYDSVREHALSECDVVLRPEKSFLQVITEYGYPIASKEVAQAISDCQRAREKGKEMPKYRTDKLYGLLLDKDGKKSPYNMEKWGFLLDAPFKISQKCCDVMKKKPSKKYEKETESKAFIGTMATESRLRKQKWLKYGCNAFEEKRQTSQPLSFWTEQDILQYIKENNLKIAEIYGDIIYENEIFKTTNAQRTGCIFCMFGITQDTDRFLRLKEADPIKYDYVMRGGKFDDKGMWIPDKGLGYKFVIDWLNEHGNLNIKY